MIDKLSAALLVCLPAVAVAEDLSVSSFDPSNAVDPISNVEGRGIKIGEGTVLHPVLGVETGYISNVFYEEDPTAAGILRILAQVGTSSLGQARLNPNAPNTEGAEADQTNVGSFQYAANVRLAYDQPLSSNDTVQETGGLGIGARFRGMVNPMGTWAFGFDENFLRSIRASNFETASNENRDLNSLRLTLLYHPPGRALSGYLYYQNTIDIFESETSDSLYPDRIDNRIGIRPMWQWLPKTQLYADVSIGIVGGLGDAPASNRKADSFPLIARLGVSTLLSAKTAVNASVGYTNGFYSEGPSFSSPYGDVMISYRYSPLGKISASYGFVHQDSVNANFYRDHVVKASIQQDYDPVAFLIQPQLHLRHYEGITLPGAPSDERDDTIFQLIGGVHYNFRNWVAGAIEYKFSTVQTDFMYTEAGGQTVELDYLRHELFAGLRVAM